MGKETEHKEKMGPYAKHDGMKKGGKAYKKGGKVAGEKSKHRLDKFARGGAAKDPAANGASPKSPIVKTGISKND